MSTQEFSGRLSAMGYKKVNDDSKTLIQITHECPGEIQVFLDNYSFTTKQSLGYLTADPIPWKSLSLICGVNVILEFDELSYTARLEEIRISRSLPSNTNPIEKFTYTLVFTKDSDAEEDNLLSSFLNQKYLNIKGVKQFTLFLVGLELVK